MKKQAVFQEVADKIAQRVNDGTYVTSQKLPSDYDLAEEFQCSRLTVRKSHRSSDHPKYLVKEKGKGTYVMKQPKDPEWIWRIAKLHRNGQSPREKDPNRSITSRDSEKNYRLRSDRCSATMGKNQWCI